MPYPNEHAARLRDPNRYSRFRRSNDEFGSGIHAIWGILSGGKVELQAIRFDSAKFTVAEAKKWLDDNDYKPLSFEPAAEKKESKSGGEVLLMAAGAGSVRLTAAAAGSVDGKEPAKLATFEMDLYTGAPMNVGFWGRVVIDLAGLEIPDRAVPVFQHHDPRRIVGHGRASIRDGVLVLAGEVSGHGEAAEEVKASAKNGFPWQASVGADPLKTEELKAGASANVNRRIVSGPATIIRRSSLREGSFVPLGADPATSSRVAARMEDCLMDFAAFVKAQGLDPDKLTEEQRKTLQAAFDAQTAADKNTEPAGVAPVVSTVDAKAEVKAERQRVAGIRAACAGDWTPEERAEVEKIEAAALAGETTVAEVNGQLLKVLRAKRPGVAPAGIVRGSGVPEASAIEAALVMGHGIERDERRLLASYGERTLEAAHRIRNIRLVELLAACAALDGINLPRFGRGSAEYVRAAFSSISLSGILGNTANKALLAAYQAVPSAIRTIFARGSVSDFKTHTRYRLTADGVFQKIAPAGELKHGTLSEDSYTQKADTYGRYFALTRQDVINDDLGAFLQIPAVLGRGWAIAIEEAGAVLLLSNPSTFFGSGHANYDSGASSALGTTGLDRLVALFLAQVDSKGKSVMVEPRYLAVPPQLKALADRLFVSSNLGTVASSLGSTSSRVVEQLPEANVHAGKYTPVCIPQIGNSGFSGYSATAWYLFADPAAIAAFEVAYLNGQEMPTIEQVGVAPDTLGLGFRGYGDFGVAALDYRGAAKSAGT